jgi:hypothetical protein
VVCGRIDEGHFNETRLDGLNWALLLYWPGEIADGNGTQQVIIDQRADPAQREGLRKILHGESTTPGATHFFVYNSTMSAVLDTLYAPIELSIDIDQRLASLKIDDWSSRAARRLSALTPASRYGPGSTCRTGLNTASPRWATAPPPRGPASNWT